MVAGVASRRWVLGPWAYTAVAVNNTNVAPAIIVVRIARTLPQGLRRWTDTSATCRFYVGCAADTAILVFRPLSPEESTIGAIFAKRAFQDQEEEAMSEDVEQAIEARYRRSFGRV